MASGHSAKNVWENLSPAFSITRRDALLAVIVSALTRSAPMSLKAARTRARQPSLASP